MSLSLYPDVLQRYMSDVFVETGTYEGGGVRRALECGFKRVISIEIDPNRVLAARKLFEGAPNIEILEGDSAMLLPKIVAKLDQKATIFLDAHPTGESPKVGRHIWPLVQELRAIAAQSLRKDHSIIIDDRCQFPMYGTTDDKVFQLLQEINPAYEIRIERNGRSLRDMIGARVP